MTNSRIRAPEILTRAEEDYLKTILELEEEHESVTTSLLATHLKVKPASVTGMIQKLARSRPPCLHYESYRGVTLTPVGRQIALEVIRHHRLIEQYLAQALGYDWDKVDAEAEKLEHVISEELEDRIAAVLGDPTFDPHGDPIPSKDGSVIATSRLPLTAIQAGHVVRVTRVRDDDPALLRYLAGLGIRPQARLTVVERAPFEGPLTCQVAGAAMETRTCALGRGATDRIFVEFDEGTG